MAAVQRLHTDHAAPTYAPLATTPLLCNGKNIDLVYLIATTPGRHSGDQVHNVKKNAAPSFWYVTNSGSGGNEGTGPGGQGHSLPCNPSKAGGNGALKDPYTADETYEETYEASPNIC